MLLIAGNSALLFVTNDEYRPFFMRVFTSDNNNNLAVCVSGIGALNTARDFQQKLDIILKYINIYKSSLLSCRKKSKVNNIPTVS